MPGAADWQDLPNSVTNAWDQSQQAQDWGDNARVELAQQWGDTQRSVAPPPTLEPAAGAAVPPPPAQSAAPPTVPAAPAPAASTPPSSGNGQYSPYDDTFRKYAGDLANDPEFIKIVAAGTLAESSWNTNSKTGDGGHSWGLFQMHDAGMGKGMGDSRLDPDVASSVMVPRYADAYRRFVAQGLQGPALAAAVGHAAELNADASGSGYAAAYKQISGGNTPNVVASAKDWLGQQAGNVANAAGSAASAAGNAVQDAVQQAPQLAPQIGNAVKDFAQNGPIGWFSDQSKGLGQDIAQSGANQLRSQVFPNITEPNHPLNILTNPDSTPEQKQNALFAFVMGTEQGGRPLFGRGGVPGADVGRNPVPSGTNPDDLEEQLAQTGLQFVIKQAREAGMSDEDITAVFQKAGASPEQIQKALNPEPLPTEAPQLAPQIPTVADAGDRAAAPPPPETPAAAPVSLPANVTQDMVDVAHNRIDQAFPYGSSAGMDAHGQLDQMLANNADPGEIARFFSGLPGGQGVTPTGVLRQLRTGSMAGGISSLGKVALSPVIQTAMRAPVGALKAIVTGNPGDIATGLQGGIAGLADGAQDALQTMRYGINYRAALTGGAQGGYGFAPGLDVLGGNAATRTLGTALTGLVRAHGAVSDISSGIGRGANAALGASPEQAAEAGQQWALRSGQYGATGQIVANALEGLRNTNPVLDVAGQILVPFYRVGYNAFTQGVERSPLGLVGRATDAVQGKPLDTGKLMNNMFGVGLAATAFAQASQGNITGERPQNGAPQWSVRIPEQANLGPVESLAKRDTQGNLWVPLRDLGPAGESLAQAAALYEAARDNNGDVAKTAEQTAYEYASHVADTTWLSTINDLFVGFDRRSVVGDIKDMQTSRSPYTRAAAQRNLVSQGKYEGQSFIPQAALAGQVGKMAGQPDLSSYFLNQANPVQQQPAAPPQAPVPATTGGTSRKNPWANP